MSTREPDGAESSNDLADGGDKKSVPLLGTFTLLSRFIPLFGWMVLILFLSLQHQASLSPYTSILGFIPHSDKFMHFCEYGVLGFFAARTMHMGGRWLASRKSTFAGVLFGGLFGVMDEVIQSFVPSRDSNVADWCADILGSSFGAVGWLLCVILWVKICSPRKTATNDISSRVASPKSDQRTPTPTRLTS